MKVKIKQNQLLRKAVSKSDGWFRKSFVGSGASGVATATVSEVTTVGDIVVTSLSGSDETVSKVPKSKSVATDLSSVPVLPPPPSFKSVHFAPSVNDDDSLHNIPTEGLPTGPAHKKEKKDEM